MLALLCVEVVLRFGAPALSEDVRHVQAMPQIAKALAKRPDPRVLFVGNSLTRRGIDEQSISDGLERAGAENVSLARLYPDDTRILEWYYVALHFAFGLDDGRPVALVVPFGPGHLRDPANKDPRRLGNSFTTWRDLGELFHSDIHTLDDRAQLIAGQLSVAAATGPRVRARVLDKIVPNYRQVARRYKTMTDAKPTEPSAPAPRSPKYGILRRLSHLSEENDTALVLVAMPTRLGYELDADLRSIVESTPTVLVDLREAAPEPSLHLDALHLNQKGSRRIGGVLGPLLVEAVPSLKAP